MNLPTSVGEREQQGEKRFEQKKVWRSQADVTAEAN